MALHQLIQRLLLAGAHLESMPSPRAPHAPKMLQPLIDAVVESHRRFDERALHFGHRYRSGFWAIYLLSALAVLCAVLPLALGWDRLRARTTAELTWYLPMVAPLLDFASPSEERNWYLRVFDPGQHLRSVGDVATLCALTEPLARELLAGAWSDPAFVASYAEWTIDILEQQRRYHYHVAIKQHALMHRVHRLNTVLFVLTAVGALLHLMMHTVWLSLVTTFFPALGASLHGALAQSEAYRLNTTSERLVTELKGAIEDIRVATGATGATGAIGETGAPSALKASIEAAIALILEEHQDWNLLVRPHHLPLA